MLLNKSALQICKITHLQIFLWALTYQSFAGVSYGLIYHAVAFSDARPMGVIKAINFDTNVGLDMLLDIWFFSDFGPFLV